MLTISDASQFCSTLSSQIKSSVGSLAKFSLDAYQYCSKAISLERFTQSVGVSIKSLKTSSYSMVGKLAPIFNSTHPYTFLGFTLTAIGVAGFGLRYFNQKIQAYRNDIVSRDATIAGLQQQLASRPPAQTQPVGAQSEDPVAVQPLQAQLLALQGERDGLRVELTQQEEASAAVTDNYREQREITLRLQGELQGKDSQIATLQEQLAQKQQDLQQAMSDKESQENRVELLQDMNKQLEKKIKEITRTKDSINLERETYELLATAYKNRAEIVDAENTELKSEIQALAEQLEQQQSSKNLLVPASHVAIQESLSVSGFDYLNSTATLSMAGRFQQYIDDFRPDLIVEDIGTQLKNVNKNFPVLTEWFEGALQDVPADALQSILPLILETRSKCTNTSENSQLAYLEALLRIRLATTLKEILEIINTSTGRPIPWVIRKAFIDDLNKKGEDYWKRQIGKDIHRLRSADFKIDGITVSNLINNKGMPPLTEENGLSAMTDLLKDHLGANPIDRLKFLAQDIRNKMMEFINYTFLRDGHVVLAQMGSEVETFIDISTRSGFMININKNFYLVPEDELGKNTYKARIQAKVRVRFENVVPHVEWSWQVL